MGRTCRSCDPPWRDALRVWRPAPLARSGERDAIARPCREICFTVVEQESRYKAKNVIDTVVYRFGDLSSAWVQAGLRALGFGIGGSLATGVVASGLWALSAWRLGRGYERRRSNDARPEAL